jgi:hypothetical protein
VGVFNPFAEIVDSASTDVDLVDRAKNGDRAALEKLVLRHQAWIYNIAVRMVFQKQAEPSSELVLLNVEKLVQRMLEPEPIQLTQYDRILLGIYQLH